MSSNRTRILAGCAAALVGGIAAPALAGQQLLLDSTSPPGPQFYVNDGQFWMQDFAVNTPITIASSVIPLNFGSGAPASRTVRQETNGRIDFIDSVGNVTGDLIQTLFPVSLASFSTVYASFGLLDPGILGSPGTPGPYNVANGLSAYRFTWSAVCPATGPCNGGTAVTFQTVLVALGADSFLIEYNYGSQTSPSGETASFSLGSLARSFTGPFSDVGPDYCISGGKVGTYLGGTSCRVSAAAVPEPSSVALIFAGLAGVGGLVGRRRRRRSDASSLSAPAMA